MIQIVQTRILSVVSLYYMAFFSISMAMLGLTGGALIVCYKLDNVTPGNANAFLSRISTAFALCIAACFALELASPLPNIGWATSVVLWLKAIVLLAAPFTVGGIAVAFALTRSGFLPASTASNRISISITLTALPTEQCGLSPISSPRLPSISASAVRWERFTASAISGCTLCP